MFLRANSEATLGWHFNCEKHKKCTKQRNTFLKNRFENNTV